MSDELNQSGVASLLQHMGMPLPKWIGEPAEIPRGIDISEAEIQELRRNLLMEMLEDTKDERQTTIVNDSNAIVIDLFTKEVITND